VSNNSEVIISVKNLSKSFGDHKVLDDVSLDIYKNELLLIIGFSGTGKSTLLKLISGLDESDSGEIEIKTTNLGMVFQGAALFDSMSIFENVAFPIINSDKKMPEEELKKKVHEKLTLVGLNEVEDLRPDELSGGMKKRVSFARAIINNPDVILYDEPTSGLDPVASNMIIDYIIKLQKELNACSILVTHDLNSISKVDGRLVLLYNGKIVWQGKTKELFTSEDPYAKQFRAGEAKGPMDLIKT
jgi:phospholipid/cholesterol/gamma-HCH transport system ATP-binding protein